MKKIKVIRYLKRCFDSNKYLITTDMILKDLNNITYEDLSIILLDLQECEMLSCRSYDDKIYTISIFSKIRSYKSIYVKKIKEIIGLIKS